MPGLTGARMMGRRMLAAGAVLALMLAAATGAHAAVVDPETFSTVPVAAYQLINRTPAQIAGVVSAQHARITDLRVDHTSPLTFDATLVDNTNPTYARAWAWYYDQSASQVESDFLTHNLRLLSVSSYVVGGVTKYAIVGVVNTGSAAKTWKPCLDCTRSFIANTFLAGGYRMTYIDTNQGRYNAIAVANTGVDARAWQYFYQRTPDQINLAAQSSDSRVLSIVADGVGTFTVVLVADPLNAPMYYGQTPAGLQSVASQLGDRAVDIAPAGSGRYAAILLDNLDPESLRLRNGLYPGVDGGQYAFYVRQVGGPVIASLQPDTKLEPASAIKVFAHLAADRQQELGTPGFNDTDQLTYPNNAADEPGLCPLDATTTGTLSFHDADILMMTQSDNRMTYAIVQQLGGYPAMNSFFGAVGATNSSWNQDVGCSFRNGNHVYTTARDLANVYGTVASGQVLTSPDERDHFWHRMQGGPPGDNLTTIVADEAHKLGKDAAVSAFESNMEIRFKGGGYSIPCGTTSDTAPCNKTWGVYTSDGALLWLPYYANGVLKTRAIEAAWMFNDIPSDCLTNCSDTDFLDKSDKWMDAEMFRKAIHDALLTW